MINIGRDHASASGHLGVRLAEFPARKQEPQRETCAVQESIRQLQAALEEAAGSGVLDDIPSWIGLQQTVDNLAPAIAKARARLKELCVKTIEGVHTHGTPVVDDMA